MDGELLLKVSPERLSPLREMDGFQCDRCAGVEGSSQVFLTSALVPNSALNPQSDRSRLIATRLLPPLPWTALPNSAQNFAPLVGLADLDVSFAHPHPWPHPVAAGNTPG